MKVEELICKRIFCDGSKKGTKNWQTIFFDTLKYLQSLKDGTLLLHKYHILMKGYKIK